MCSSFKIFKPVYFVFDKRIWYYTLTCPIFQKDFVGDAINTMSLKDRKKLESKLKKSIRQLIHQASLSGSFMGTVTNTGNQVTVLDGFHGDKTLLTSHETTSFSLLAMSAKVMVFNVIKPSMKLPLRLALDDFSWKSQVF